MSINITFTRTLDDEFVSDVLITAFDANYGGCWYWAIPDAQHENWLETNKVGIEDSDVMRIRWTGVWIYDGEQVMTENGVEEAKGSTHLVDASVIQRGIQTILDVPDRPNWLIRNYVMRAITEGDAGDIDSDAADVIVQYGLWGECVYG